MPHIEARDVSLIYDTPGGTVPGVSGVSFCMEASEFLCIVGPSGCGKTINAVPDWSKALRPDFMEKDKAGA